MEIFEGLRKLIQPTEEEKRARDIRSQVKEILRAKEKELKEAGVGRGVMISEFDGDFNFRWGLRMGVPSEVNRTGWESKSIHVKVSPDATVAITYGYKDQEKPGEISYSQHLPVEARPEYKLAEKSQQLLAQEFGQNPEDANNQTLPLDKRIEIAMKFAGYVSDGRYDRSLD